MHNRSVQGGPGAEKERGVSMKAGAQERRWILTIAAIAAIAFASAASAADPNKILRVAANRRQRWSRQLRGRRL